MDELIGNLQTYEMNKKQGTTVNEGKKEKSIALKISQSEVTEEEARSQGVQVASEVKKGKKADSP